MLSDCEGMKRDFAAAMALFQRACDRKFGDGCNGLGNMQLEGQGVPKDANKAVELLQMGCDYDSAVACYSLGVVYRDGLGGTAFDHAQAKTVFEKSCNRGYADACDAMKPKAAADGAFCSGYG